METLPHTGAPAGRTPEVPPEEVPLLDARGLSTVYPTEKGKVQAVRDVSLRLGRGGILGLVGESGCGKSATLLSIMRLVPHPGKVVAGEVRFQGEDLLRKTPAQMRGIRGRDIAMVFQDPMSTLNPAYRVGDQIAESLRVHGLLPGFPASLLGKHRRREREMVLALMREVGIPSPDTRHLEYPHQFSGGMQQRVLIAIALACRPALLLADEPTTALDVTVQGQILAILSELSAREGLSILLVTHDMGVVAQVCRRVGVMYAGQVVEVADVESLFARPAHPYTRGLIASIPGESGEGELYAIPGSVPSPVDPPRGCRFHTRCEQAMADCRAVRPEMVCVGTRHAVACHLFSREGRP